MAKKYGDLTGKKFGKLTVIERADDYIAKSGLHTMQWLCKCDCGNEIVMKDSVLKREIHTVRSCGCSKEVNNNYEKKSDHMSPQDIVDWEDLYDYVNSEIMEYPKPNMLSKNIVLRLKGLRFGQPIRNNKTNAKSEKYSFKVILNTFKFCKNDIKRSIRTKDFYSDDFKFNYIIAIVNSHIGAVYTRMLDAEKAKERTLNVDTNVLQHSGASYIVKETKTSSDFDDLW